MRHWLGRFVATAAVAVLAFVAVTIFALESGGVAELETRRPDGSPRQTHVWFVVQDGELWVEVGSLENGWWLDVQQQPELSFRVGAAGTSMAELDGRYLARVDPSESAHPRLRAALRTKYGWRDRWVGISVDSSRSLAVRLTRVPARAGS